MCSVALGAVSVVLTAYQGNAPPFLTQPAGSLYVHAAIYRFHAKSMPHCEHYIQPGKNSEARLLTPPLAHHPALDEAGNWLRLQEKPSPQEGGANFGVDKKLASPICLPLYSQRHLAL